MLLTKTLFVTGIAAALLLGQSSQSDRNQSSSSTSSSASGKMGSANLSSADRNFIMKAAEGGKMEVEMGQKAAQQASNSEVKQFGQRMVDDHGKANQELMQLAQSKGISLDKSRGKMSSKMDRMSKLTGDQFDRAYMRDMVMDHQKDVTEFEKASNSAKDPDVRAFAAKTLPTLRDHLQQARTINQSVAGGGMTKRHGSGSSTTTGDSTQGRSSDSSTSGNSGRGSDNTRK